MKECWKQGDTVQPDSQENKAPSNWERSGERACPPGQEDVIIGTDQMPFAIIVLPKGDLVAMHAFRALGRTHPHVSAACDCNRGPNSTARTVTAILKG
jgi:hypothetical protein